MDDADHRFAPAENGLDGMGFGAEDGHQATPAVTQASALRHNFA